MKKKNIGDGVLVCPECDGDAKPMMINVSGLGVTGWRCRCGYEMLHPEELEKAYMYLQAQKRERVKISKRGNSYMITIPKAIADAIGADELDSAEVFLKDRRTIVVEV